MANANIVVPNTRMEGWKETLKAQGQTATKVVCIEPDKQVYEFLSTHFYVHLFDPQHIEAGVSEYSSAIQQAYASSINVSGALIVLGFKLDLDSVGATAVLLGGKKSVDAEKVALIDTIDNGTWASKEWDPTSLSEEALLMSSAEIPATKILGAALADRSPAVSPGAKVQFMLDWLQNGLLPEAYEQKVREERTRLLDAKVSWLSGVKVVQCQAAGVSSLIYHNTEVGGKGVPFGIAFNPNFRGLGPKFSVIQWSNEYINTQKLWAMLNKIEPAEDTWGGNPKIGIGGSPLGSALLESEVAEAVSQCLTEKGKLYLMETWATYECKSHD